MKGAKPSKTVDLVTGRASQEYFFDPSLVISEQEKSIGSMMAKTPSKSRLKDSSFFQSKHLFMPCTIIKALDDITGNIKQQQSPPPTQPPPQPLSKNQKKKQKKKGKQQQQQQQQSKNNSGSSGSNLQGQQPIPGPTLVKTADGVLHKISDSTKLIPMQPSDYDGVDDILHLSSVSEASLLHTLRQRFKNDNIYTSAGLILISINPYKSITVNNESIYSKSKIDLYRKSSGWTEKPPHLFQVADRAYTALMDSAHSFTAPQHMEDEDAVMMLEHHHAPGRIRNQSIIISGESGAGKTEATKIIMKFLAKITKKTTSMSGNMVAALEDRVLSSNPLLETFGNAQTLRNNNSSRFGKFIHIYFSCDTGAITGASISNYLLEKTRITDRVDGERNYHIFYQLLSAAKEMDELGLDGGLAAFRYLENKGAVTETDAESFVETVKCLTSIGLTEEEQQSVFGMAAAVLHLGNIQFDDAENEAATISEASLPSLEKACELLGLDEAELSDALLKKVIVINGKEIHKPQNVAMADDKRDALAKMTYSSLFLWLVQCINEKLSETSSLEKKASTGKIGFIGVLDIYGFECFDTNGFEQLLINYCNEKLQRHFNRHLFEVEQELYANEGVDWSYITFNDNQACLELIEGGNGGKAGIINTLDDAWSGMGPTSDKDAQFAKRLYSQFAAPAGSTKEGHPNFVPSKFGSDRDFTIVHYAGEVKYTVDGFVEKNMETLSNELKGLGDKSTLPLSKKVYFCSGGVEEALSSSQRSSIRGVSVGSQFRTSLQSLVADLEETQPHYIRCIKPNDSKAPNSFHPGGVLKQLRYSGMMEAIRIRQEGYSLREPHESFFDRFSVLLTPADIKGDDEAGIVKLVKVLSKRLGVSDADWQVGHSKIFLRRELSEKLERLATLRVQCAARTLTRFGAKMAQKGAGLFIVVWMRFRLHMLKKRRDYRAASKVSALARGYRQRRQYAYTLSAVVRIQSHQRRFLALHKARKLVDPFYDIDFRGCKKLLAVEQERLDNAVANKNFQLASQLEAKIKSISEAIEEKRPLTRSLVDEKIAAVRKDLEDAVKASNFTACGALQEKLEELQKIQAELPTISELREAVASAEAAMSAAVKSRDFAGAAEAQAKIDSSKSKLCEALAAGEEDGTMAEVLTGKIEHGTSAAGYESRAELEADIADLTAKIQKAIEAKDFGKASSLQPSLDEKEALRAYLPTVEELRLQIDDAKAKMEDAVTKKFFAKAEALNTTIAELEKKLEQEKEKGADSWSFVAPVEASFMKPNGERIIFTSRADLEKEIASFSSMVKECVNEKQFKKADALQADLNKLIKLRELLPSVSELKYMLQTTKKEMQGAISQKQFAKADKLQSVIVGIEEKLKSEQASNPEPAPSPKVVQSKVKKPTVKVAAATVKATKAQITATPTQPKAKVSAPDDAISVKTMPVKSSADSASAPRRPSTHSVPAASVSVCSAKKSSVAPSRSVAKLRPALPLTGHATDSILSVTQLLAKRRGNACVVVDDAGNLAGILTDTDVTRRVVGKHIDPATTTISVVMTPKPTCVALNDPAMEALTTMVENHFRHLPVIDNDGMVVGVLDIAKCLNDAISKLEKSQEKSNTEAQAAVKQALGQQGANGAQAAALQALLGGLMSQAFGSKPVPTLRSLLAGKPATTVSPDTSIRDAGLLMAENRKAALVVEAGELVGVFGFKDMMARAVAAELPMETTAISKVMTPDPATVTPDITVLEALQIMHDDRFLTLPVCEQDGTVVGLVDVMDVIYGCGGADGWRSVFSSAMEMQDDASDSGSTGSFSAPVSVSKTSVKNKPQKSRLEALDEGVDRPVSSLRPSKPIVTSTLDSILNVSKLMASKRGTSTLVTSTDGSLAGIFTTTDLTRRVVAKGVELESTVSTIMTADPKCVTTAESAMDALTMMVENHFRHLPVIDEHGAVVGVLDIAKCLNSAISKIERVQKKNSVSQHQAMEQAIQQSSKGPSAAALQSLLSSLMSQAFGNDSVPTLRSLLADTPRTVVTSDTSVKDASILMAERRKGALVLDENEQLVGIFGFKDMLTRVVAKELPFATTPISDVMTRNPATVSPDMTVLEALQSMHDQNFLTLPVCEDDGIVVGLVDVIDVMHGCGGAQGWRAIFSSMMEMTDDLSDSASLVSERSGLSRNKKKPPLGDRKTVAKLRPSKPNLSESTDSILSVTQLLKSKRGAASLIVNSVGELAGILTDTDVTRRVVGKFVDPASTEVSAVMTPKPTCVTLGDSATDALMTMVENHFRHLPVVDTGGAVVGLLDIAKCLNDAISKLERSQDKSSSAAEDVVKQAIGQHGGHGAQAAALQALLGDLMSQAFGNKPMPTLRGLLAGKPSTAVTPDTSIRDAGLLMAENRKAALVVDDGELVGVFGFKDMMTRAVAAELPLETTAVSEVMTSNPATVLPDITVLEALQTMHDDRFLTLPVCEEDGTVVGLVDVMDVIYGCGGADGWRSIFRSAMELEDLSTAPSATASNSKITAPTTSRRAPPVAKAVPTTPYMSDLPNNIPTTLEFDMDVENSSTLGDERGVSKLLSPEDASLTLGTSSVYVMFKVSCPSGTTHRIRCGPFISELMDVIAAKVDVPRDRIRIEYEDDEGDTVIVSSDHDVSEAYELARKAGKKLAKLSVVESKGKPKNYALLAGGGATAAALLGALAFVLMRPSKK